VIILDSQVKKVNTANEDSEYFLSLLLKEFINSDKISSSEVSEKILDMKRKNEIETKYKDKIKTRKDGRQYYIYIDRKQLTAGTYSALIEKLYDLEYGKLRSSLADLYPKWLIWRRDYSSISPKTLKEYTYTWNAFLEKDSIINIPVVDLKAKDFLNLFRKWTKKRSITKKRFGNIKSLLNGIYQYSIEQEIVEHNPIFEINCSQLPFKPVNNSNDVFTVDERNKLLNYLQDRNDIYSLAIQLDFHLLIRIGELLALKWTDIEGDYIHIQSQRLLQTTMDDNLHFSPRSYVNEDHIKGNTDYGFRFQPLTPKAKAILARIRELNPDGEHILMKNGRQLLTDTFNEHLHKYCHAVGIKGRSSHKIRFTVASILYSDGMPLTSLQKLLGHTNTAMTLHYIRQVTPIEETTEIMCSALG